MKKTILGALMTLAAQCYAATPLEGMTYGDQASPTGKEWESPEHFSHNKEQPRANFYSFEDKKSARKVLPEHSNFYQSLNGQWKFNWVNHPDKRPNQFHQPNFDVSSWDDIKVPSNWNLEGLQKDGTQKYGTPIYCNQPVIFKHSVKVDDWKGGVMRTPPKHWTTYKDRNEVGSYRRNFEIPADWDGRETFVKFAGVDSFFYLWINGKYVGFSKNSRNAAIFNITKYLKEGNNVIAAEVYRNSDGSFLEAQDMFRLPGIFRTVSLHSTPKVQIRDLYVVPQLDDQYKNGSLKVHADIRNLSKENADNYQLVYSLYANKLYSEKNRKVRGVEVESERLASIAPQQEANSMTTVHVNSPKLWSAELPYRYTLVAELKNAENKTVETVSAVVGFRTVVIKDTLAKEDEFGLAGRYFYVNGKPVKLKGVNRHETAPETGHTLTRKQMEDEIMLMKRGNINHVRNSHYPTDEYFYHLCDKYGIYLEDEANIESHQYYYGEASISHPPEWKNAHVGRVMEMIHQNKNYASIVIWSPGNEAGPGKNFVHAYNAIKEVDLTRPVQYERNNNIVDMGSNQYPSVGWVRGAVKGKYNIKYPFHISEYAHSMGNACGNLVDYWEAMESTNFFCGGAIWDWVDQSVYNYEKDGTRYLAYGGNFGDFPNDGQFVMNGILFGDREPKPQYFEVKKVYQHIGSKLNLKSGKLEIFNKYYFKDLSGYNLVYALFEDGNKVDTKTVRLPKIAARSKRKIQLPCDVSKLKAGSEYFVKVQYQLNEDTPWAKEDFVQAEEQFALKAAETRPSLRANLKGAVLVSEKADLKIVSGLNFTAKFNLKDGSLYSLVYNGKKVIADGKGPKLDAFRAFTNNDNWFYTSWFDRGLHNLKHKATSSKVKNNNDGTVTLSFTVVSQAPNAARIHGGTSSGLNKVEELTNRKFDEDNFRFVTNQIWTVYADGSIELQSSITANESKFILPRLGYSMRVPNEFSKFSYYGRGPIENYADRKTGQFIERFETTVAEQFANFPKPQEMANREDVRWCALTNQAGQGAVFIATSKLSVNALPYTSLEMTLASHPHKLPKSTETVLHLDTAVTGLGGNSCGQGGPLGHDRVYAGQNNMGFIIRPAGKDLSKIANVSAAGQVPIGIARSRTGFVKLSTAKKNASLVYSINNGAAQDFKGSFKLRDGGLVTAWYKGDKDSASSIQYNKIESIDTVVVFASSEEPSGGTRAKNLTDGNANTIWHSMYSVTVAKYPHWVDFDSGEAKNIKGFIYLPRQDGGNNGDIKDYSIHLSMDGKNWGKAVHKGRFGYNKKEQKVLFKKPIKARYIRFTGLSSQNGADFAGGAEFNVLAD